MTKELSKIIEDINNAKSANDPLNMSDFITQFRTGMEEEPEKIGDLLNAYENVMKKSFPDMPLNKRWSYILKNMMRFCFIADNNPPEIKHTLKLEPSMVTYLMDSKLYGPATKALSNYLKCEGNDLILKIYYTYGLN